MSGTSDKIKGAAKVAAGSVEQGVGHVVGNPKLEAKGAATKVEGKAQEAIGKAKDMAADAKNSIKAAVDKT